MRPHDIAILLKIASKGQEPWLMKDLAQELFISPSEVSESLHSSVRAKLLSSDKKHLNKLALLEFLKSGLPYVFPLRSGPISRGIKTAISAPPLDRDILSDDQFIWTYGGREQAKDNHLSLFTPKPQKLVFKILNITN